MLVAPVLIVFGCENSSYNIQYARRYALGSGFCALSARGTFVRFAFASIVSRTVVSSDSRRRSLQNPKRSKLTLAAEPRASQNVDG
jgi:hypothetical protein